ncbi:MAG: tRNA threonylcarbamoyladenosine dehydratase [Clostridia bacterium]|nr:tRNA threonylcarbamoyladenosine dehydratase [Clostridia bacterium]
MSIFDRTDMLLGRQSREKLNNMHVAVLGIGGVGSFVCEALARAGIGELTLIDSDTVSESNINRQLIALHSTIGHKKTAVMAERVADINPEIKVNCHDIFFSPETAGNIDFSQFSFVVDAVDTVSAKLLIIEKSRDLGIPVISSMGTGNKLDPTAFRIADIEKTSVCPLARVMRYELKKRGIKGVRVLYSTEQPIETGERTPASISFVPSVAGLIIAGEVIKELIKKEC